MSESHTVRITASPTGYGPGDKVEVGAVDITRGLRGYRLDAASGHAPRLTLDLLIRDVTPIDAEGVQVIVPQGTRDALVALGWTPPGGERE